MFGNDLIWIAAALVVGICAGIVLTLIELEIFDTLRREKDDDKV